MPIHINLLHEQQQVEMERRKDPLRLGVLVILVVAVLFSGFHIWRSSLYGHVKRKKLALDNEWAAIGPKMKEAEKQEEEFKKTLATAKALQDFSNHRFYWAPFMEQLLKTMPRQAQIVSLLGEVDPAGGVTVSIEGLTAGNNPRDVAESLRLSLRERLNRRYDEVGVEFNSLEDDEARVRLEGKILPTARFEIKVNMKIAQPAAEEQKVDTPS